MKRVLALFLVLLALYFIAMGAGTIDYDQAGPSGLVSGGSLSITQHEYERCKDSFGFHTDQLQAYTHQQVLFPCFSDGYTFSHTLTLHGHTVQLMNPTLHNYVDQIVLVENTGQVEACVRTFIAIPTHYENGRRIHWLHLDVNRTSDWIWAEEPIGPVTINGTTYDIYYATSSAVLQPGQFTTPSLLGFYLDTKLHQQSAEFFYEADNGSSISLGASVPCAILVTTQAAQPVDLAEVNTPEEVLNAVYGVPSPSRHPWSSSRQ